MKKKTKRLCSVTAFVIICLVCVSITAKRETVQQEADVSIHLGTILRDNRTFDNDQWEEPHIYTVASKNGKNAVEVVYDWIYTETEFLRNIHMLIECDALPDAFMVYEEQFQQLLAYDLLQPVTDVYATVASPQIKSFVESGGSDIMDSVVVDGEMMAIPFPNLTASGINVMWIRQDWLDELGLKAPETIDELKAVSDAFVSNQMGGEDTIGILGPSLDDTLTEVGKCCFGFNPIFAAFQAYPKYWILNEQGEIVYGSVQKEARDALEWLAKAYQEGVIDRQIFSRADSREVLNIGKAGIFFGPWWAAEYLETDLLQNGSIWKAYSGPKGVDGIYRCTMPATVNQYLVIHKKCEIPEGVIQILNDSVMDESGLSNAAQAGIFPLFWECDFANEIEYTYSVLKQSMERELMDTIDFSMHKFLQMDLEQISKLNREPYDQFGLEDWGDSNAGYFIRLYGIINGVEPIVEQAYESIDNLYFGQTDTMKRRWSRLLEQENRVYAQIILGQKPIEAFDEFVMQWEADGGSAIQKEVAQAVLE